MITVSLSDELISENMKAIDKLKALGFSDTEIQTFYDSQIEKDKQTLAVPNRGRLFICLSPVK